MCAEWERTPIVLWRATCKPAIHFWVFRGAEGGLLDVGNCSVHLQDRGIYSTHHMAPAATACYCPPPTIAWKIFANAGAHSRFPTDQKYKICKLPTTLSHTTSFKVPIPQTQTRVQQTCHPNPDPILRRGLSKSRTNPICPGSQALQAKDTSPRLLPRPSPLPNLLPPPRRSPSQRPIRVVQMQL